MLGVFRRWLGWRKEVPGNGSPEEPDRYPLAKHAALAKLLHEAHREGGHRDYEGRARLIQAWKAHAARSMGQRDPERLVTQFAHGYIELARQGRLEGPVARDVLIGLAVGFKENSMNLEALVLQAAMVQYQQNLDTIAQVDGSVQQVTPPPPPPDPTPVGLVDTTSAPLPERVKAVADNKQIATAKGKLRDPIRLIMGILGKHREHPLQTWEEVSNKIGRSHDKTRQYSALLQETGIIHETTRGWELTELGEACLEQL